MEVVETTTAEQISIHALHEESDGVAVRFVSNGPISIHALHEESDLHRLTCRIKERNFNPRSP